MVDARVRTGPVKLSVAPDTYKHARSGAEGLDPTWMLEDADEVYGISLTTWTERCYGLVEVVIFCALNMDFT